MVGATARAKTPMETTRIFCSGAVESTPTSGEIKDLQKVRVEIASLSAKEDFSPTRTGLTGRDANQALGASTYSLTPRERGQRTNRLHQVRDRRRVGKG